MSLYNVNEEGTMHGWIIPTNWVCLDAVHCVKMMLQYENDLNASSGISGRRDESGTGTSGTGPTNGTERNYGNGC